MRSAVVVEFPGWGYPLIPSGYGDVHDGIEQNDDDLAVIAVPDPEVIPFPDLRIGEWKFTIPDQHSDLLFAGVHLDIYIGNDPDPYRRAGVWVITDVDPGAEPGDPWEITARAKRLTASGRAWWLGVSTPEILPKNSFMFPYLPRTCTSAPMGAEIVDALRSRQDPYDAVIAQGEIEYGIEGGFFDAAVVLESLFDHSVIDWTTQLSQEIGVRGGIQSSSGYTITLGRQGFVSLNLLGRQDYSDISPDLDARGNLRESANTARLVYNLSEPQAMGDLADEVVYSGTGTTWDSDDGVYKYTSGRFLEPGAAVQYWGNDTTHWCREENGDITYIPDICGTIGDHVDIPHDSVSWPSIPSGTGRSAVVYVVDPDSDNPWRDAEVIYTGYIEEWSDSAAHTAITFQIIDALQWARSTRRVGAWNLETFPRRNVQWQNPLYVISAAPDPETNNAEIWDTYFNVRFSPETDTEDIETQGYIDYQFIEIDGYAFPHAWLTPQFSTPASGNLDNRYSYFATQLVYWPTVPEGTGPVIEDSYTFFFPPTVNWITTDDQYLGVLKWGVAVDDGNQEMQYRSVSSKLGLEIPEDQDDTWQGFRFHPEAILRSILLVTSRITIGASGSQLVGALNEFWIPSGYENLPRGIGDTSPDGAFYGEFTPWQDVEDRSSRRPTSLLAELKDGPLQEKARHIRVSQLAYRAWNQYSFQNLAQKAKPCHVFFSTSPLSGEIGEATNFRELTQVMSGGYETTRRPTVILASVADVILQVLLSTGTSEFDRREYDETFPRLRMVGDIAVRGGVNGRHDVLPPGFGLGLNPDVVDVAQIENFGFTPYTQNRIRTLDVIRLDEVPVANLCMRYADTADPAKWLTENILEPFGLALITDQRGRIKIASMDSLSSDFWTPSTGWVGVIPAEAISATDYDAPPDSRTLTRDRDSIQRYTESYTERALRAYNVYGGWNRSDIHSPAIEYLDSDISQTADSTVSPRFRIPTQRTSGITVTNDLVSEPLLIRRELPGREFGEFEDEEVLGLEVEAPDVDPLPGPNWVAEAVEAWQGRFDFVDILWAMRNDKVLRWSVAKTEIEITLGPFSPEVGLIHPGTQILIEIPELQRYRGTQETVPCHVLITSVSRDITSGDRVCRGYLIARDDLGVPVVTSNDAWAAVWHVAVDQSGLPGNRVRVYYSRVRESEGLRRYAEDTNFKFTATAWYDEYHREIPTDLDVEAVFFDEEPSGYWVIEFNGDVPVNAEIITVAGRADLSGIPLEFAELNFSFYGDRIRRWYA